jgi:phosphate-selective porin OprO and OprP
MRAHWPLITILTIYFALTTALRVSTGADDDFDGAREPYRQPKAREEAVIRLPPVTPPANQSQSAKLGEPVAGGEGGDSQLPAAREERSKLGAYWDNGAFLESADKTFRFHMGGRLDFDNTWYTTSEGLPFRLQDGSGFRRLRLRADGTVNKTIDFVTEVNFANIQEVPNASTSTDIGSVGVTNVYVTFKEIPVFQNVRIGHFRRRLSLEDSTSANYYYYMERSPGFDAFINPDHYVSGILFYGTHLDERMTNAVSLTRIGRQTENPFGFGAGPGAYAATVRLTGLPTYEDDGQQLIHVGIDYSLDGADNNTFTAANRPLVRAGAGPTEVPNIIQTGTFFTPDPVQIVDAELAGVWGRFSMSAEYQVERATNLFTSFNGAQFSGAHGDATYQGVYVESGFFLNPCDHRRYNRRAGTWDRQIAHSTGAFVEHHMPVQLLCRYSYLDLVSGSPVLTPASGTLAGRENDITAGVNWYINSQVCFMVDYVYTHLTYVNNTQGDFHGLGCRLHMDF